LTVCGTALKTMIDQFSTINFRSPAAVARLLVPAVIGLALDLWTKYLAMIHLQPDRLIELIPGWIQFHYVRNYGAVFGLGEGQRVLFLIVSLAAIVFLGYLFGTSGRQRLYQVVLGLLLAGVIGNMYDRLMYGYVRDMIHILPGRYWPGTTTEVFPWVFNIADSLLCIGVAAIILYSLFVTPEGGHEETAASKRIRR
jgi:signal peptidase II